MRPTSCDHAGAGRRARAPVRLAFRRRLQCFDNHRLDRLVRHDPRRADPRLVIQPLETAGDEPHPPFTQVVSSPRCFATSRPEELTAWLPRAGWTYTDALICYAVLPGKASSRGFAISEASIYRLSIMYLAAALLRSNWPHGAAALRTDRPTVVAGAGVGGADVQTRFPWAVFGSLPSGLPAGHRPGSHSGYKSRRAGP